MMEETGGNLGLCNEALGSGGEGLTWKPIWRPCLGFDFWPDHIVSYPGNLEGGWEGEML